MDDPKISLPPWLPWATTACLAALVACLGELWILERARIRLMQDQVLLTEAALKGAENQLEAERILGRRERALDRGADLAIGAALLLPPGGRHPADPGEESPWGVVVWDADGTRGRLRFSGLAPVPVDRAYRLQLEGARDALPQSCAVFQASVEEEASGIALTLPTAVVPGSRFVVVLGPKDAPIPREPDLPGGSIVLATLPYTGRISGR